MATGPTVREMGGGEEGAMCSKCSMVSHVVAKLHQSKIIVVAESGDERTGAPPTI